MRRSLLVATLVLAGCPKPPTDEPPPPAADPGPALAAAERPVGCEAGPGWLGLPPCGHGGAVYVIGEAAGDSVLARAQALNRARGRLVELGFGEAQADGASLLRDGEGWDSYSCAGRSYALARHAGERAASSPWPACPAVVVDDAPAGECPRWTRRSAWRDGATIIAVGAVQGIKNPAMAAAAAKNRALAEAQKLIASTLTLADGAVSVRSGGGPLPLPGEVETAICGETLYAKVTVSAR